MGFNESENKIVIVCGGLKTSGKKAYLYGQTKREEKKKEGAIGKKDSW